MGPTPMAYMQTPMGPVPVPVQFGGHWAAYPPPAGYPPPGMTQVTAQHSGLRMVLDDTWQGCWSTVWCTLHCAGYERGHLGFAIVQISRRCAMAESLPTCDRGTTLCRSRRPGMRRRCRSTQPGRRQCRRHRPTATSHTLPMAAPAHPRTAQSTAALVCHWHVYGIICCLVQQRQEAGFHHPS